MAGSLLRLLWRAFVGCIAVVLAYGTVFLFYPYLDDHLPLLMNFIILYILTAYLGIPFLVRLWHLVLRPRHLPQYAVSTDGWSSDPVNIAIVCRSKNELQHTMKKAGWHIADPPTVKNSLRLAIALVFEKHYPTAPFSSLYLFGRRQDIGFQIQTGSVPSPRHRHHVRFWQLNSPSNETAHHHTTFWHNILQLFSTKKRQIWIGTATHDVGPFALRVRNLQITHKIDHETNKERAFVMQTLYDANAILRQDTIAAGQPIRFRGQTFGINIATDGTLQVVEIKRFYCRL